MAKRVSSEAALLMLHWQNSVCDPKGIWGKNLCRQIEKNSAIKNAQSVLSTARNRGVLTIFVNIGWRPGFPELPENQYYPLLQSAKDDNKGIVGTWEVDVIDALRPVANEPMVINFGSDSFEGTDLRSHSTCPQYRARLCQRSMYRACCGDDHQARGEHGIQRYSYKRRHEWLHRQQLRRHARYPAALLQAAHIRRIQPGGSLRRYRPKRRDAGIQEFLLRPRRLAAAVNASHPVAPAGFSRAKRLWVASVAQGPPQLQVTLSRFECLLRVGRRGLRP